MSHETPGAQQSRRDDDITGPIPTPGERSTHDPAGRGRSDHTRSFQMPQHPTRPQGDPWASPAGQPTFGGPSYAPSVTTTPHRRRAPWVAVPVAAVLAAGLASGTTYALVDRDVITGGTNTVTKVVQANPADYVDASGVNWTGTAAKVTDSVVAIKVGSAESGGGQGSGVVLDTEGNIVTNNHVVSAGSGGSTQNITVTLSNNLTYKAKVIGTDPSTDLAVIRLQNPPSGLTPIALGDDVTLEVGQPVMAVGNPLGLSGTVTTGIISALNRPVTAGDGEAESTTNAVQTNAAINPGNSGGALVNARGQLIGINSSIASVGGSSSSQSGNIGIGFAIPVSVVKSITGQLIKNGSVQHARLGVQATTDAVQVGDATETAAKIKEVVPGSAADQAGLKVDDAITEADGRQIGSSEALVGYVRAKTVGDKVELTVVRDGKEMKIVVALGKAN